MTASTEDARLLGETGAENVHEHEDTRIMTTDTDRTSSREQWRQLDTPWASVSVTDADMRAGAASRPSLRPTGHGARPGGSQGVAQQSTSGAVRTDLGAADSPRSSTRQRMDLLIREPDMAALLAAPEEPLEWVVDNLVMEASLTVIAAQGGAGKSWLGMALCAAVQAGEPVAGMAVKQRDAVYVDGEMGQRRMTRRMRDVGLDARAFRYFDANGLDLGQPEGIAALQDRLAARNAGCVFLDSLRKLAPGKSENESDDMAPIVADLQRMAQELGAAVFVAHHSGNDPEGKYYRGSSAIRDQADALFGLQKVGAGVLALACDPARGGKMRDAEEPAARYVRLVLDRGQVVAEASAPDAATADGHVRMQEQYEALIVEILRGASGPRTKEIVAHRCGTRKDNQCFKAAWTVVRNGGLIEQRGQDGWVPSGETPEAPGLGVSA